MVFVKCDCVFWLLYFVNISKCISSNLFGNMEVNNNLTEEILSDTGGIFETNASGNSSQVSKVDVEQMLGSGPKLRIKRQSGGGRYEDAAKMPQVKVLRLFLQLIRNTWVTAYTGGAHPLHHEVPKPFVLLFRNKFLDFFFPKVGQEAEMD